MATSQKVLDSKVAWRVGLSQDIQTPAAVLRSCVLWCCTFWLKKLQVFAKHINNWIFCPSTGMFRGACVCGLQFLRNAKKTAIK